MRGTVTPLVVVLLVASGLLAGPVSAATAPASGIGAATAGAVDGSGAVTSAVETVENTTNTSDSTNTTDSVNTTDSTDTSDLTDSGETTDNLTTTGTVDDGTTVNETTEDGTVNGGVDVETTDDTTVDATVNGSVSDTSLDAALATNGSSVTTSAAVGGDDAVAVSADATVTAEGDLLTATATRTADAGTSTPTGTAGENRSAGAGGADGDGTDSGSDGDVPAAATGVALAGVGAAAVTLLARRSATIMALAPDIGATLSRLPSPLTQLRATVRRWLPRVLAAVGYSRYDDSDPLSHETRAELYELIAASPGTYLSELSERADVPTSTIRHHLDVLVREGVVTTANVRGKRRYFSLDAGNEALAAALSDDASAAVIDCLAEIGPASVSTIAEQLDRDVSTVSHHLGRLAEDDLVEREREGRSVYSRLAPEVAAALGGDDSARQPRRA